MLKKLLSLHTLSKSKVCSNCLRNGGDKFIRTSPIKFTETNFGSYSTEQINQILTVLNDGDVNTLLSYEIAKTRANKVLSWRIRNGSFHHLDDILYIEGFSLKLANKFFDSILKKSTNGGQSKSLVKQIRQSQLITPKLDEEQCANIRSCVAVSITVNNVSWSRLQLSKIKEQEVLNTLNLTHWEHESITDESKKLHLSDLVQRSLSIACNIPTADCYVFESSKTIQSSKNINNATVQNVNIEKAQVEAMIAVCLASRNCKNENNVEASKNVRNVFYLKKNISARLFNYLIGLERVSSQEITEKIMHTPINVDIKNTELAPCGYVRFPQELISSFTNASSFGREYLSRTLLLNIAFVRLILLKDEYSLSLLNKMTSRK